MLPKSLTHKFAIEAVEKKIKIAVADWKGNCYLIACNMVRKKVVEGKPRYGLWLGPVAKGSIFGDKPVVRHGWIETPGGTIVDPTRWVFEDVEPYIFVGEDEDGWYDAGAQTLRAALVKPPPDFDGSKEIKAFGKAVPKSTHRFVLDKLGHPYITKVGLFWIANLPINDLKIYAKEIYKGLKACHMGAFVPVDQWELVMEG